MDLSCLKFRLSGVRFVGQIGFVLAAILCWPMGVASQTTDVPIGVTFVCSGEHIYVENCNIRDLSDSANCMVAHPDHLTPTGMNSYTYVKRGDLKKLLPTCTQPSAQQLAAAKGFQKRQQDLYEANVKKAEDQMKPTPAQAGTTYGQPQKPKTPEERAMTRCITSGRLPASCTGNSLLGAFGKMVSSVLPTAAETRPAGPEMAGVYVGAGDWRLDFTADGVLVNCSYLSPDERRYKLEFKPDRTVLTIDMTPKPLVLTVKGDGTITGPGPVTIDGVVATGGEGGGGGNPYSGGYRDSNGVLMTNEVAASGGTPVYDTAGNRVYTATNANGGAGGGGFSHRRATCPGLNLSSKGAGTGVQTMQTDLLKTMFGGDKGPPTPPGIRMRGIFAASTGFSVEFFPESAVLGCGPDAARAYPYHVTAEGAKAVVKIEAADHPLTLAFRPDGALEPGTTGPYQVHGRTVTGQDQNDDFTFAPMEQTCDLAVLTASKTIPSAGGMSAASVAGAAGGGAGLSTPQAPLGNATLTIVSGFPALAGVPNPLAGRPYLLLRDSYANVLASGGVTVPAGVSAYKYAGQACGTQSPDCKKISDAVKASAASAVRADANGSGTFPGVPPGTYYLMISARVNNQPLVWGQAVQMKAGANSMKLDPGNAVPLN